jgi:DnaJ-class molecular chaperone
MSPIVITCTKCGGVGEVSDPEGLGALLMRCPKCGGSGSILPDEVSTPEDKKDGS